VLDLWRLSDPTDEIESHVGISNGFIFSVVESTMNPNTEQERLAIEILATLVNIKTTMVELLLKPAGVPREIYGQLLYKIDSDTGRTLSKRQIAPLILHALSSRSDYAFVIRALIEIAAGWSSFHLAKDEFEARAAVQKARECLGEIELHEARERKAQVIARKEELNKMESERADQFRRQLELLLMMFDAMAKSEDPHQRGYLLQDLVNRTWDLFEIPVTKSFTSNAGAEQIDGSFRLDGWIYLVECRWREKLADIRQVDGLKGQVDRSGKQAMGLFMSVVGWSDHVPGLLKQNPEKSILLMDGFDLRSVLTGQIDLRDFLLAKAARLTTGAEPFFGAVEYLKTS